MAEIRNGNSNSLVSGTSSKDSINNTASNVTIQSGKGNDYIRNNYGGSNAIIDGGAGNDHIENGVDNTNVAFAKNISIFGSLSFVG